MGGGIDWTGAEDEPVVRVFEYDVYTVLLTYTVLRPDDPTLIPTALHRVPWKRRPRIEPELLLWYPPNDPDQLVVPALDSHSSGAPELDAVVPVDHWVLFSSDEADGEWGAAVGYPRRIRNGLRGFLPDRVVGRCYGGGEPLGNGDFGIGHRGLLAGGSTGSSGAGRSGAWMREPARGEPARGERGVGQSPSSK